MSDKIIACGLFVSFTIWIVFAIHFKIKQVKRDILSYSQKRRIIKFLRAKRLKVTELPNYCVPIVISALKDKDYLSSCVVPITAISIDSEYNKTSYPVYVASNAYGGYLIHKREKAVIKRINEKYNSLINKSKRKNIG